MDIGSQRDLLAEHNPNDPRLNPVLDEDDPYYIWVFWQLCRSRPYTQGQPLPLSLASFKDYMALYEDQLEFEEILLLQQLDTGYMAGRAKK